MCDMTNSFLWLAITSLCARARGTVGFTRDFSFNINNSHSSQFWQQSGSWGPIFWTGSGVLPLPLQIQGVGKPVRLSSVLFILWEGWGPRARLLLPPQILWVLFAPCHIVTDQTLLLLQSQQGVVWNRAPLPDRCHFLSSAANSGQRLVEVLRVRFRRQVHEIFFYELFKLKS